MKNKLTKIIFFLLSFLFFLIPSILINTMNLQNALVSYLVDGGLNYNFVWSPVTAAIYLAKCFCYTIGLISLYVSFFLFLKDK
ncbi:MAG: hypothetical protein AB9836_09445 [Aminipila sp.]